MSKKIKPLLRLLSCVPTLAVFLGLGYLAYRGHESDWTLSEKKETGRDQDKKAESEDESAHSRPNDEADGHKYGTSPFDPTLSIIHDPMDCELNGKELKLKDKEMRFKSGIYLGEVQTRKLGQVLTVTGTVEFDSTKIARVSPRAGGAVWRIDKNVGDAIEPKDVLAVIDAAEVGRAKAAFLQAKVQLDLKQQIRSRYQQGVNPDIVIAEAESALREAQVTLQTAYQAILNLGFDFKIGEVNKMSDTQITQYLQFLGLGYLPNESTNNLLPIFNPLRHKGFVLQRDCVQGETVAALQTMFVVGDTSEMTVLLDIRQEDARQVAKGQMVKFTSDGDRKETEEREIYWISEEMDPKTRTVKARIRVPNTDGRLKAKTFGTARITIQPEREMLTIPDEAVQWEGCSHIVFVKTGADAFEVRKVNLGIRQDGFVEVSHLVKAYLDPLHLISDDGMVDITYGLEEGEKIAVLGSHVLKSQLFKDRLGKVED